jgi:oxalate decarboxylase/phosphoglucose isomerase-like protein (cupin superfamily)
MTIQKVSFSNNPKYSCRVLDSDDIEYNKSCEKIIYYADSFNDFGFNSSSYSNPIYSVYRYLFESDNFARYNVKFDLTIIYPALNNSQKLNRTRGHYHKTIHGHSKPYFDIYQVHNGDAILQLHSKPTESNICYLVLAKSNDILMLPPDLCHVTYNIGNTPLYFSNWCTRNEHLDYETMKATYGPAIEIVTFERNELVIKINRNIHSKSNPTIKFIKPLPPKVLCNLLNVDSLYIFDWQNEPHIMKLLNNPSTVGNWIEEYYIECQELSYDVTT